MSSLFNLMWRRQRGQTLQTALDFDATLAMMHSNNSNGVHWLSVKPQWLNCMVVVGWGQSLPIGLVTHLPAICANNPANPGTSAASSHCPHWWKSNASAPRERGIHGASPAALAPPPVARSAKTATARRLCRGGGRGAVGLRDGTEHCVCSVIHNRQHRLPCPTESYSWPSHTNASSSAGWSTGKGPMS